jgi:enoyl-CoA hydratase
MTEPLGSVRSLPFRIERADGIGELVIDQPPVNALDSRGWHELAATIPST